MAEENPATPDVSNTSAGLDSRDGSEPPLPPGTAMKVGANELVSALAVIDRYEARVQALHVTR